MILAHFLTLSEVALAQSLLILTNIERLGDKHLLKLKTAKGAMLFNIFINVESLVLSEFGC